MIVEQKGNTVVVRVRDDDGKRKVLNYKGLPYCYVETEDAQYIEDGRVEDGYECVFGQKLSKVTMATTDGIRNLNKTGNTWEANVSFCNQVLAERVKKGDKPIKPLSS